MFMPLYFLPSKLITERCVFEMPISHWNCISWVVSVLFPCRLLGVYILPDMLITEINHSAVVWWVFRSHSGREKMAANSQTTFSKTFYGMKMYEFRSTFHINLFLKLTTFQHWFRYWLGVYQATSHYLNQWWLVYWCIYESFRLNELNKYYRLNSCFVIIVSFFLLQVMQRSFGVYAIPTAKNLLKKWNCETSDPLWYSCFRCYW